MGFLSPFHFDHFFDSLCSVLLFNHHHHVTMMPLGVVFAKFFLDLLQAQKHIYTTALFFWMVNNFQKSTQASGVNYSNGLETLLCVIAQDSFAFSTQCNLFW